MSEPKETDFTFCGMRFRSMEWLPAGAIVICNSENESIAIYSPDKGWNTVTPEAFRDAKSIVLSPEGMREIARRVIADTSDTPIPCRRTSDAAIT